MSDAEMIVEEAARYVHILLILSYTLVAGTFKITVYYYFEIIMFHKYLVM